jgi:CRP-like cAMP-binding protein
VTTEERVDHLSERHQALSESVELLAAMERKYNRRIARANRRITELALQTEEANQRVAALAEVMAGLVQLARRHEERLDQPEF